MEKEDSKKLEERVEKVRTAAGNVAKEVGGIHKKTDEYGGEVWKGMYCIKYAVVDGEEGKEIVIGIQGVSTQKFSIDDPNGFAKAYIKRMNKAWNQYENKKKST